MVGGAALNFAHVPVPFIEQGVAASVLIFGLLLASSIKLHATACASIVGLFAAFHGYAHAAEMTSGTAGTSYAVGFIAATAILHVVGIGVGVFARSAASRPLMRISGAGIAACGLLLMLGA
jgi:urease accessory protein